MRACGNLSGRTSVVLAAWENGRGMLKPLGYVNTYSRDKNKHKLHFSRALTLTDTTYSSASYLWFKLSRWWNVSQWSWAKVTNRQDRESEQEVEPGCLLVWASYVASGPKVCLHVYAGLFMHTNEQACQYRRERMRGCGCVSVKSLVTLRTRYLTHMC